MNFSKEGILKLLIFGAGVTALFGGPLFIFGIPMVREATTFPLSEIAKALNEVGVMIPVMEQILGIFLFGCGVLLCLAANDIERYLPFVLMDAVAHVAIGFVTAYNLFFLEVSSILVQLTITASLVLDTLWGLVVLALLHSLGYLKTESKQNYASA